MGNEIRHQVLHFSLLLESYINNILAKALGILEVTKSKSFNYTNQSLSFNQKVNLLLDINLIEKDNEWKFQAFMEIRNKFMHVLEIDSYVKCFEYVDKKNKIIKAYSSSVKAELQEEDRLHACCFLLYCDVLSLGGAAFQALLGKVVEDVDTKISIAAASAHKEIFDFLFSEGIEQVNVNTYWKIYTERFENHIGKMGIDDGYTYSPFAPTKKKININLE